MLFLDRYWLICERLPISKYFLIALRWLGPGRVFLVQLGYQLIIIHRHHDL